MSSYISELTYLIALLRTPAIGTTAFYKIVEQFSDLSELFKLTRQQLINCGFAEASIEYLLKPNWQAIEKDIAWQQHPQNTILTWRHDNYPKLLREITSTPPILFIKGQVEALSQSQLAVVGSRYPTVTGKEIAYQFAEYLAKNGLTITSGLALGIDSASHQGALAAKGKTVAVVGTGLDRIYPARNKGLAEQIIEHGGAIVSEFPLGVPPVAENFPRRNRIISGLSTGVMVVEAALQSGSLITARYALEQGREVFAVPGSIHNPLTRGCHALIKQGAKLVEKASDILEELEPLRAATLKKEPTKQQDLDLSGFDAHYRALLECVDFETTPVDLLIHRSGMTAEAVSSMMVMLELQGHLQAVPGGYIKKRG